MFEEQENVNDDNETQEATQKKQAEEQTISEKGMKDIHAIRQNDEESERKARNKGKERKQVNRQQMDRKSRARHNEHETQLRRERDRERQRLARQNENDEKKKMRLQKDRERKREARKNEDDFKRLLRRDKDRERRKFKRQQERGRSNAATRTDEPSKDSTGESTGESSKEVLTEVKEVQFDMSEESEVKEELDNLENEERGFVIREGERTMNNIFKKEGKSEISFNLKNVESFKSENKIKGEVCLNVEKEKNDTELGQMDI